MFQPRRVQRVVLQSQNSVQISIYTSELTQQISQFKKLLAEEKELQRKVNFYEKKIAKLGLGPGESYEVSSMLQEEQVELAQVRMEISLLEDRLEKCKDLLPEQRTEIMASRIRQIVGDIKSKREQILIYQGNINYLEEKIADYGVNARVDLNNELDDTRKRLSEVHKELTNLNQRVTTQWRIDSASIGKLIAMSDKDLAAFVQQKMEAGGPWQTALFPESTVEQEEIPYRKQTLSEASHPKQGEEEIQGINLLSIKRRRETHSQFDPIVRNILYELKQAIYPDCFIEQWKIYYAPNELEKEDKIFVKLNFDKDDNPLCFTCFRYDGNSTIEAKSRGLSRQNIIEALVTLFEDKKKKHWLQFRTQTLPKSWIY